MRVPERDPGDGDIDRRSWGLAILGKVARNVLPGSLQSADRAEILQECAARLLANARFLAWCASGAEEELRRLAIAVVRNEHRRFVKKRRRRAALPLEAAEDVAIVASPGDDGVDETVAAIVPWARLYPDLPRMLWVVLVLVFVDGMTKSAAAKAVGIRRRELYRLLSKLGKRLQRDGLVWPDGVSKRRRRRDGPGRPRTDRQQKKSRAHRRRKRL